MAELVFLLWIGGVALVLSLWAPKEKPSKSKVDGAPDLTKSVKGNMAHSLTRQTVGKQFQF